MTVLTADGRQNRTRGRASRASGFPRRVYARTGSGPRRAGAISATSTPFQHRQWLEAWYGAFADVDGVEPLIAIVTDAATGEQAVLLPLIRRLHKGIRIVEFADLDLTDYNAPMLGPAAPRDAKAARAMWRDLQGRAAALARRRRSHSSAQDAGRLDGRPNPLALLDGAGPCALNGNVVITGEDYDAWRFTLERTVRKELERSWRVFTRDPAAAFRIVTDKDEALRVLSTMESQQGDADAASRAEFYPQ